MKWMLPFPDKYLTLEFGVVDKLHPNGHRGDDWAAPSRSPLRAVARGTVVHKDLSTILGYVVVLKVPRKLKRAVYFGYCHMARPSTVNIGERVECGDVIGMQGNTGMSTGEHLHLTAGYTKLSVFSGPVFSAREFIKKRLANAPTD